MKPCECGCGEQARTRFVYGHQNRTPEARAKLSRLMSARRREQIRPAEERFAPLVGEPDANGCTPWRGATSNGYGVFRVVSSRTVKAHRFAYERDRGQIADGCEVHHLCENRLCVNPAHLVQMPRSDHRRLHNNFGNFALSR